MKVIIVGAGEIGRVSAETISRIHDVLVIEKDEGVSNVLKSRLNVSTLKGDGTNPKTLAYAIENHQADMILSTLNSDSNNLFVCLLAKRIKPDIRTVASITNPDFRIKTSSEGVPGVDTIISPELVSAEKMYRLCILENAIDYESVQGLGVSVATFSVKMEHEIVGKVMMHLDIPDGCTVFAIYRDNILHTDTDTLELHAGDHICVFGTDTALEEFNRLMGVEYPAKKFVILGGTIVGRNVARMLAADKKIVKIVDKDEAVCRDMAKNLTGVAISCADFTDPEVQINENIFTCDALMTTSHADDTNLLMSMTAQRHNAQKVITRYFTKEYEDIFEYTGIETIMGYYRIVSNEITKCIISDETALMKPRRQDSMFFICDVDSSSPLKDVYLGDLNIPDGISFIALKRKESLIYPRLDTKISEGDSIIIFTSIYCIQDLSRIIGKSSVPEV